MGIRHDDDQSIGEFTVGLDRELRGRYGMGVEIYKAAKNLLLSLLIAYIGLQTGMQGYQIALFILAVGAPDILELFLGNGLKVSLESDDD
ncbi:hypothetical protein [Haloterrigena salifodinae]|uniref:hypothetical protein n=1 Tax=Haloterrigena salifodinae TaxID=2675099 RepID=UPI000F86C4E8|nr:hypothetical protein [Haloterrigena salifodinae]